MELQNTTTTCRNRLNQAVLRTYTKGFVELDYEIPPAACGERVEKLSTLHRKKKNHRDKREPSLLPDTWKLRALSQKISRFSSLIMGCSGPFLPSGLEIPQHKLYLFYYHNGQFQNISLNHLNQRQNVCSSMLN